MRLLCAAAGAALLACTMVGRGETFGHCGEALDAPMQPNASMTIDSRPAGLEVLGTDKNAIHVTCTADDSEAAEHVNLRLAGGKLTVSGSYIRHGNLKIRVELPHKTNLRVIMPAGQVKVNDLVGDKDIDLYAGQIIIGMERGWDYRRVDASVDIGDVKAAAYGVEKGGFFRSFTTKTQDGEYRLRAHVMTGEVDLVEPGEQKPE